MGENNQLRLLKINLLEKPPMETTKNSFGAGHRIIVDKSSAYGAKGPGFNSRWRQEFIIINCIVCSVHLRK